MSIRSHLLVSLALALASGVAMADDVYRWTDAHGAVSYGQKPPADAQMVRKVDTDNISVIPSASSSAADQKLSDAYTKSRAERLQQELAESHIAAEKARADLDRQTALLEAQRAQADAGCSAGSTCVDQGGLYYPVVAPYAGRGIYPGYGGPGRYGSGYSGLPNPVRPRPPVPAINSPGMYPSRPGAVLN